MAEFDITPVPAPRMTRSDKWRKPRRPCVAQYFAFRDHVKLLGIDVPAGAQVTFHMPVPPSWSAKKKLAMQGQPHLSKPDLDNLLKALLDSVYDEDQQIWKISAEKRWRDKPGISIETN